MAIRTKLNLNPNPHQREATKGIRSLGEDGQSVKKKKNEDHERSKGHFKVLGDEFSMKEGLVEKEDGMVTSLKHKDETSVPELRLSVEVSSRERFEKAGSVTGMHSTPSKPSIATTTSSPVPQTNEERTMQWEKGLAFGSCKAVRKNPTIMADYPSQNQEYSSIPSG